MSIRRNIACLLAVGFICSGCAFMRQDSDFGVQALCEATGQSAACLNAGDIISLQQTTGYLDITRAFPHAVRGIGSVVAVSDSSGVTYVGNAFACLPESERPFPVVTTVTPPKNQRTWSETNEYVIYPGAFVRLERPEKLGAHFDAIRAVRVDIRSVERERINPLDLQQAIENAYSMMSSACREVLLKGDYVVVDALRVGVVAYSLRGRGDRRLQVTGRTLPQYLTMRSSEQFTFEGDYLLTREPKYFAIGGVMQLGTSDEDTRDFTETIARHCKYVGKCFNY